MRRRENLFQRLVAALLLASFLPSLLFVGLLLRACTDQPVLLTDEVVEPGGAKFRIHRFRTTGQGTNAFRLFGRFLRLHGIDDWPALWDVVRGEFGLMQVYGLLKREREA